MQRFLLVMMLVLAACSPAANGASPLLDTGVGGTGPEQIVQDFFEDLNDALKDPALANDQRRAELIDQMANYFAPNERGDQRITLGDALDSYVKDLSKLEADQSIRVTVSTPSLGVLANDGQYALVSAPNAVITMDVLRSTLNGTVTEWSQEVPLSKIIGRPDGTIPTVKVGNYWFLTEGEVTIESR